MTKFVNILILSATHAELHGTEWAQHLGTNTSVLVQHYHCRVHILVTGVGSIASTFYLTKYLLEHNIDLVINVGVAGTFNPRLALGTSVIIDTDIIADLGADDNGRHLTLFDLNLAHANKEPFKNGILQSPHIAVPSCQALPKVKAITVNTTSGSSDAIAKWTNMFAPDIETMEGAAVAYVCTLQHVPYILLRAVSNVVEPRNKENWRMGLAIKNLGVSLNQILSDICN